MEHALGIKNNASRLNMLKAVIAVSVFPCTIPMIPRVTLAGHPVQTQSKIITCNNECDANQNDRQVGSVPNRNGIEDLMV